jgi:hypothetical protein
MRYIAYLLIIFLTFYVSVTMSDILTKDPIEFSVKINISEDKTKISFEHVFKNVSNEDYLLEYYIHPVLLFEASPLNNIQISRQNEHPIAYARHAPPTKDNIIYLKPGEILVKKNWRWSKNFSEFVNKEEKYFYYIFRPGIVSLTYRYHGSVLDDRFGYPVNAKWLTGTLDAKEVEIELP